jgi:pyruvate formate lyase activating enzyme
MAAVEPIKQMDSGNKKGCVGLVGNIQKYSLHDGPGIRTTVFLKGCPLSCAWCHNPENLMHQPQLVVNEERCVRCGQCVPVCPGSQIDSLRTATDDCQPPVCMAGDTSCLACGACAEACPTGAKTIVGRWMTQPELLREILADRIFFDDSKGGVTFSGGEPLLQHPFLRAMLIACRGREIHTTVDTCGFASEAHFRNIVPVTDLFLFDLKFIDDAKHREFTGVSNEAILHNLQVLGQIHRHIWIRVPVIPGVNDSPKELEAMGRLIAGLKAVRQVNLLPYHKTGIHKFSRMGRPYCMGDIAPPSQEYMEAVAERFASLNLPIIIGG